MSASKSDPAHDQQVDVHLIHNTHQMQEAAFYARHVLLGGNCYSLHSQDLSPAAAPSCYLLHALLYSLILPL